MRFVACVCAAALMGPLAACIPENDPSLAPPPRLGPEGRLPPGQPPAAEPVDPSKPLSADLKKLLKTVESLKDKLKDRPRDFNVNVALGNLFYDNGKYLDAIEYYGDAVKLAQPAEKRLLEGVKPAARVPAACLLDQPSAEEVSQGQKTRAFEAVVAAAEALPGAEAAACLEQLRLLIANVHAWRGNAWYLAGDPAKAREDHTAALALDDDHPEALFVIGALTLEQANGEEAALEEGTRYWKRLLEIAPEHPRAETVRSTLPQVKELFGRPQAPMAGHPPVGGAPLPALPAGMQ